MKTLFLDCGAGVAGDMLLAALLELGADLADVEAAVRSLGLPELRLKTEEVRRHAFRATRLSVEHPPESKHRHLSDITEMIDGSDLTTRQKEMALAVFTRLAQAEARVHGHVIEKVHFHEVGAVDSIADVVGSCVALDLLGVQRIVCSPIPTGSGIIDIAHGKVSVPAPATAELLAGIPLAESPGEGELTTPTGAALVSTLVQEFGAAPAMTVQRIGYGAGSRDPDSHANILRALLGEMSLVNPGPAAADYQTDRVWQMETNLDDVPGESVAYACERLLARGALDVWTTPTQMKKGRPGVTLSLLCHCDDVAEMQEVLFRETSTLGVRRWLTQRTKLRREEKAVQTEWGEVAGKVAHLPGQPPRFAPEFSSCREIAALENVPLEAVYRAARRAFAHESGEPTQGPTS